VSFHDDQVGVFVGQKTSSDEALLHMSEYYYIISDPESIKYE
jgi:hypothetical protein